MSIFTPKRQILYAPQAVTKSGIIHHHEGIIPSYAVGFARRAEESEFPEDWEGLIGAWMMCFGATGNTVKDLSGNGRDLSALSPTHVWQSESQGSCVDFVGDLNTQSFYNADSISFSATDAWTIVFRCQTDNDASEAMICGQYNNTNNYIWLREGEYLRLRGTANNDFTNITTFTSWADYAIVCYGDGDSDAYVNGILKQQLSGGTTVFLFNNIGSGYNTDTFAFDGRINRLYIYNRALSASEIAMRHGNPLRMWRKRRRVVAIVVVGIVKEYLAGESALSISTTGELKVKRNIAGSSDISISTTASLSVTSRVSLQGSADVGVSTSGSLSVKRKIAGSSAVTVECSADLSVAGIISLKGTAGITTACIGTLSVQRRLIGASQIQVDTQGRLGLRFEIKGSSAIIITTTGTIEVSKRLIGTADVMVSTLARLTGLWSLKGTSAVQIEATGTLRGMVKPAWMTGINVSHINSIMART